MKKLRKVLALVLAMVMVLAMGITAFAQTESYTSGDVGKGSITIKNPTRGQTYAVYKLFDATQSNDGAIAYTGTIPNSLATYFQKDAAGNITGTNGNTADFDKNAAEANALKEWTEEVGVSPLMSVVSLDGSPLTFNNLPYGYYVVTTTLAPAAISVTSTNKTVAIYDKNTSNGGQDTTKTISTITNSDTSTAYTSGIANGSKSASVKVGDKVSYKVTFTAVNYNAKNQFQTSYTVVDNPSGLDIDINKVGITIKKQEGTDAEGNQILGADQYANSTHKATISKANNGKVTISIPWGEIGQAADATQDTSYYDAPATVTITYDAILTSTEGSNDVEVNDNGVESKTTVETTGVKIQKVDSVNSATTLTGAEFDLYDVPVKLNANGEVVAQADGVTAHQIKVALVNGEYVVNTSRNEKISVNGNGLATIKGLKEDTYYYLLETKAPDGYTLPTQSVKVKTGNTTTIDATAIQITNTKGNTLPSTGGIGTTIFYVLGAILVLGAGVVLVSRRRMAK